MPASRLSRPRSARRALRLVAFAWLACGTAPLWSASQADGDVDEIAQPVEQPVPGLASQKLNAALELLARNPRDVDALIAAGQAAVGMGDVDAAVGFFQRADQLAPGNARIKAGLASVYVRDEDPFSAIPLFDEAEKAGPIDPALLGERGLAYDLVGDNVTAQVYYKRALQGARDDETVRRLALSQAISGDRRGMEVTLAPLLQKQDKAAWRTRAFALAILGNTEEAESIARSTMPADLASGISGYLRYMPKLTAAQQAAAANLGHFPRAAEIGHDDPRLALYQRQHTRVASAEQALTPAGQPLGTNGKTSRPPHFDRDKSAPLSAPPVRVAAAAPVAPAATREVIAAAPIQPPSASAATSSSAVQPMPKPVQPVAQTAAQAPAVPVIAPKPAPSPIAGPGFATLGSPQPGSRAESFDLAQAKPATPAPVPTPAPARTAAAPVTTPAPPKAAPPPARPRSLSEVFADFSAPSREAVPQSGAVDLRKLKSVQAAADSREDAAAKAAITKKPAAPSHPSRIWVQVATGRDKKALAFDWRRMLREEAPVFRNRKGYTSAWGQTNRLLTGPFESELAANGFIAQLKKAGVDGSFIWTSPAGQVVDLLPAEK